MKASACSQPSFRVPLVVAVLVAVAVVVGWGATAVDAHGDHDIKNFHRSRGSLYGGGALEAAHHQMPTTDRALVEHVPPSAIVMPENATEEEIWLMAGDMANYRSLSEIISVSLPLPINLIFVGFDGDGEHGLELVEDNFNEWFEHIDHFVRHRIVPVGEEQTTTERRKTPKTHVKYQLNYNLVKLDPLVNTIVEDTIYWHLRPEDPNYKKAGEDFHAGEHEQKDEPKGGNEKFYVDAFKLSRVLYHLILSVNLTDSYTLFIMNPKKAVGSDQTYGYRVGFSEAEISELQKRTAEWSVDPQRFQTVSEMPDKGLNLEQKTDLFPKSNIASKNGTYRTVDLVERSQEWAHWYIKHMVEGGVKLAHLCAEGSGEDDPNCLWKTQRAEEHDIVKLAQAIAASGSKAQVEYLASIKEGKAQEDCLVDNWVGHARYAWLDLSAGPFKWGPVVAGQGVRSHSTLPRVPSHYALHPEADPNAEQEELQASPSPVGNVIASKAAAEERTALLARLKQDLVVLQGVYEQRCAVSRTQYCDHMASTIQNLEEQVRNSQGELADLMIVGDEHEGEGALLMLDNFLAHLASVISRTISHLITPASPLFRAYYTPRITFHFFLIANHREFNPRKTFDFEQFKAEMIKFKLPNQEFAFVFKELDMSSDKELTMAFTHSLRTGVMPTLSVDGTFAAQTIRYLDSMDLQHQLHLLNIHSHADEELEKVVPKDGKVSTAPTHDDESDDDHEGDNRLPDEVFGATALPERSGKGQTSRHIPVFFFSLNDVVPVFIDKYYQAKALSNVVLAVQSQHFNWTSKLACNDKPIRWDLRDPLKPLLAATALHYGGLVPMHITYDEPNQCAAQDWLWSVGDSPLAHTSQHHRFSLLQRDLAYRSFVTNAIEDSIKSLNAGIKTLSKLRTTKANLAASQELPFAELSYSYKAVRRLWDNHARAFATLNFESALSFTERLHEQVTRFQELVLQTEEYLDVTQCAVDIGEEASVADILLSSDDSSSWWILPASLVFNFVLALLWILLRKRSRKVKTN